MAEALRGCRVYTLFCFLLIQSTLVTCLPAQAVRPGPTYEGMCDASAAAVIGNLGFVVANDEDNLLRVYRRGHGGPAVASFDMNVHLIPDPNQPETDIEAATWLGGRIYWITSHGRNRKAKFRESRTRLFATRLVRKDGRWTMVSDGEPYYDLINDLLTATQLQRFKLDRAAKRAPKDKDGLNIEGLAATPDGSLWIGFRNPIRKGKALIVPLHNPHELIRTSGSAERPRPELGFPIEIDLDGLGVRSIEYVSDIDEYLILAGPPAAGSVALYRWTGSREASPRLVEDVDFGSLTPEAFVVYKDNDSTGLNGRGKGIEVQFFSDDGTRMIAGTACKQLKDPAKRRFRTVIWPGLLSPGTR